MMERLKATLPALLAAILIGAFLVSKYRTRNRFEDYSTAVGRYDEYSHAYADAARMQRYMLTTCYGEQWTRHVKQVVEDLESHKQDAEYLRQKSAHYAKLKDKYAAAANHPEAEIVLDPPLAP